MAFFACYVFSLLSNKLKPIAQVYSCPRSRDIGAGRSVKSLTNDLKLSLIFRKTIKADLVSFISKKANSKKVILVIHDWGSAVGFELARRHPNLVTKIIGINCCSLPGMNNNFKRHPSQLIARNRIH